MFRKTSCKHPGIPPLHLLAGLLAPGLSVSALAQSVPFPTYAPGETRTRPPARTWTAHPSADPWASLVIRAPTVEL